MQKTTRRRQAAITILATSLTAGAAFAQLPPFNASEVSNFDQAGQSYADVWGDGDFAYLAHFGQRVIDIVDLTDPANPVLAATYDSGIPGASAQDVKVADGLMFVGLESVATGCQIVDVRDPYDPVKLTDVDVLGGVHNVFYDQGWLYLVDSSSPLIDIVDLRAYDPDSPPATISTSFWRMTGVGQFVHDITVQDGRLYASAWNTLRIYDVSDIPGGIPPLLGTAPGDNVHAAWPTDDGRFVVVAEEHSVGGLALFEILPAEGDSLTLEARDYHFVSGLQAGSVHNPLVIGNRAYVSWYAAGVQVLEIDPDTATLALVASFDTTTADGDDSTFAGNWGVYPFLGADKVLASDGSNGLFVIDVDANVLRFKYPSGLPRIVPPGAAAPIELEINPVGAPPLAGSVTRHAAVVGGGPPAPQVLTDEGGGLYAGTLPAVACGDVLEVSFSADNTLGTSFVDPPGAPAETYRVDAATGALPILEDDFDLDLGWTVDNSAADSGDWQRGDPIGTGAQPEFDGSGAVDGSCFFTEQGVVGDAISSADVDLGPVILTSPPMDFSAGGGLIRYDYWLFNDDEGDPLIVEISSDGAAWVEARRYEVLFGGWREDVFHTDDFVAPSDQVQVRFIVSDNPNNSVTEAAVDNFSAVRLECSDPIFADGFESGDTTAWSTTGR